MAEKVKTVISLVCERAADVPCDDKGVYDAVPGMRVIKFPCSGMIQPLMIEAALKAGAEGVIVCGCQLGDCYYREGNRMIRERLLGERPPGLKKTVDRRRVVGLWLSKLQTDRFISESKEFIAQLSSLPADAKPPEAKPAQSKTTESKPAEAKGGDETKDAAKDSKAKPKATEKTDAKEEKSSEDR